MRRLSAETTSPADRGVPKILGVWEALNNAAGRTPAPARPRPAWRACSWPPASEQLKTPHAASRPPQILPDPLGLVRSPGGLRRSRRGQRRAIRTPGQALRPLWRPVQLVAGSFLCARWRVWSVLVRVGAASLLPVRVGDGSSTSSTRASGNRSLRESRSGTVFSHNERSRYDRPSGPLKEFAQRGSIRRARRNELRQLATSSHLRTRSSRGAEEAPRQAWQNSKTATRDRRSCGRARVKQRRRR
jgi:hypothetical protein